MNNQSYIEDLLFMDAYIDLLDDLLLRQTLNSSMDDEQLKRKDKIRVHLEKVQYNEEEECECEICFEKVKKGDKVYNLDCFHKFHADCLMEWMHYKQDCPVCRTPIR